MAAPSKTTDIRTDVSANIAMNHVLSAARDLHDAMWWENDVHLVNAESNLRSALTYVQSARDQFAKRAKHGDMLVAATAADNQFSK